MNAPDVNHGFLIASNSINNISGGNLKDIIRLETIAAPSPIAATTKPRRASARTRRARPRRQKMASIGVEAMGMLTSGSSSTKGTIPMTRTTICTPVSSTPTVTNTTVITTALLLCQEEAEQASASSLIFDSGLLVIVVISQQQQLFTTTARRSSQ